MMRASGILRRIVVPVENDPQQTHEHLPRGAKAVIDARAATRLSAVVGDGEFAEFAVAVEEVAATGRAATAAAVIRRTAPVAAIGAATLACLWAGARMNHNFSDMAAHAAADGGSFGRLNAAASPMFGAGRDRGDMSGDPAMNLKNSARVAAMAVTAAVTANGALAGDAVQWRVADGGNGHWYAAIAMPSDIDFPAATAIARQRGGYLFSGCGDEFDIVIQITDALSPQYWLAAPQSDWLGPWIGIQLTGNIWGWSDGSTCTFDRWDTSRGQPNCPGIASGETVAFLYSVGAAPVPVGHDVTTSRTTRSLLIEWSADCNNDNIVDYGQILNGQLADTNTNGIPDCCEPGNNCCVGDIYENHIVDGGDLGVLLSEWGAVTPTTNSDLNRDGFVNGADLGMLLANWGPCGG